MAVGPADLLAEYDSDHNRMAEFGEKLERLVKDLLGHEHIRVHSVTHRVKDRASLAKKVTAAQPAYRSVTDVHDVIGVRIITHFPDEIEGISKLVEREFASIGESRKDKSAALDPDRFGYLSVHYVLKLSPARSKLPEYSNYSNLVFELQLRSILQHAWAEIEHDLGYKSERAVPTEVRRRFARLAGLLELGDLEFQGIRDDLVSYAARVSKTISRAPQSVPLDAQSLTTFVQRNQALRRLDLRVSKYLGVELPKNSPISTHADALQCAGLQTIAELNAALKRFGTRTYAFTRMWLDPAADKTYTRGRSLFFLSYVLVASTGNLDKIAEYIRCAEIHHGFASTADFAAAILDAYNGKRVANPRGPLQDPTSV